MSQEPQKKNAFKVLKQVDGKILQSSVNQKTICFKFEKELYFHLQHLKFTYSLPSPQILKPLDYSIFIADSGEDKIIVKEYYQSGFLNLQEFLQEKMKMRIKLSSIFVQKFLLNMIELLIFLESKELKCFFPSPKNIFFNDQLFVYKIPFFKID